MISNLIIGGASKSGTTALYYYLRQHPDICLSAKKELHFFSEKYLNRYDKGPGDQFVLAEISKTFEAFLKHFKHCDETNIRVDISPSYLFHYRSADEIKKFLGENTKVVFILRNPVDKIFSQYIHLVGEGREHLSFKDGLAEEQKRTSLGYSDMWLYRRSGFYSKAINHFQTILGGENIKVYYYEEFFSDPKRVLSEICNLIGIDETFEFSPIAGANRSGTPKSTLFAKLLAPNILTYTARRILPKNSGRIIRKYLKSLNTGEKPKLSDELRLNLNSEFKEDIRKLEKLVGKESGWIN